MNKLLKILIYPFFFIINHLGFKALLPKKLRRVIDATRTNLIKLLGKNKIGKEVFISKNFFAANYNNLEFGNNGTLGMNCEFYSYEKIKIGDNFLLGSNIVIHTSEHIFSNSSKPIIEQGSIYSPVTIGNNVYIGSNVVILSGISIGSNIIIAAGSVVTKNLENGWIYGGNPAKKIKSL